MDDIERREVRIGFIGGYDEPIPTHLIAYSHVPGGMVTNEYVRADLHRGAVEALRDVRAELVAPSGRPITSAEWCARAIARIDDALGGQ